MTSGRREENLQVRLSHIISISSKVKQKLSKTGKITPIEPPCKKTIYTSQADADEAVKHLKEIRCIELSTYHCSICGFWHLTSK